MRLPESFNQTPWAIAVSGGADSMALLYRLYELRKDLTVLHFNHGFTEENGDAAEALVRATCAQLHLPLKVGHCDTPWPGTGSKEAFARNQRYAFFKEVSDGYILLAHQSDDRAENLLLRLMRGCGLEGLTSFKDIGEMPGLRIYRPLFDETHAMQIAWLKDRNLPWIEDNSNANTQYTRNALRHELFAKFPLLSQGINASLEILNEENAYLAQCASDAILIRTAVTLRIKPHTADVIIRRLLRDWLISLGHTPTLRQLHLLLEKNTVELSTNLTISQHESYCWEVRES